MNSVCLRTVLVFDVAKQNVLLSNGLQ